MKDYLEIGPCCPDEDCVQVGQDDYYRKAHDQCTRYIEYLESHFGEGPEGTRLSIRGFPHDFGRYYEVICYYSDEVGMDYAYKLESHGIL